MTPAERVEAAGRWLACAGGAASPGDIRAAISIPNQARQADTINALRAQGLVEGDKRTVRLTPAGWARFGGVEPVGAGEVLDRVLAGWPYAHRAFLELMVCTVVARHHLGAQRRAGHLGFMAIGETGTGKSAMGDLVCHLFGFPAPQHTVHVPLQAVGSLLGRRERDGDGWRWLPAPMTRLPFLVLDEFDKAEELVQRRAWVYLHDVMDHQLERQMHELLPTTLLVANPPSSGDRYRQLRPEYRRRSVVLDTAVMATRGAELRALLRAFYANTSPGDRLPLDRLVPPATLEPAALEVLDSVCNVLTSAGALEFPGRGLEMAVLGRCALLGPGADQGLAAMATAVAYLQVTETVPGQVLEGWVRALGDVRVALGEAGTSVTAAIERGLLERTKALAVATAGRQSQARADLGVLEQGERLAERCRQAIASLDGRKVTPPRKPDAAGLRRVLRTCATRAAQVSTAASLRDVEQQAADLLERAERLMAEMDTARRQVADDAQRARQDVVWARQAEQDARLQAKASAAAARRQRETELAQVVAIAKPLEALYVRKTTRPGESPLPDLARLKVNGVPLLTYQPPAPAEPVKGWSGRLRAALEPRPSGTWQVAGTGATFAGDRYSCAALAAWGPGTREVLAPALVALHGMEDQLRAQLGTARSRRRPAVAAPTGMAVQAPAPLMISAATRYGLGR